MINSSLYFNTRVNYEDFFVLQWRTTIFFRVYNGPQHWIFKNEIFLFATKFKK